MNFIKVSVTPVSIERLELALNRIVVAVEALGIKFARGEKTANFEYDGETIGFSISEAVRRKEHVPTVTELAEREAAQKRRAKRWSNPKSRDAADFSWLSSREPEWDYHPTGQLAFELEQTYLLGGNRLNVAISRARYLAVWIANPRLLEIPCGSLGQMELVNGLCWVRSYARSMN